ncbi:hypothetical protein RF11_12719 [Thelohanellus kitauei]|uniref:Tc1-like transposase DDE domain-containing protein n=1 Tax=Thelohanellus kitauei TaxID=669202 RepID=A0A0C2IMR0_THEKT|nr:hypothetical protein RF11_12719 [Thelohanellus kitauei]
METCGDEGGRFVKSDMIFSRITDLKRTKLVPVVSRPSSKGRSKMDNSGFITVPAARSRNISVVATLHELITLREKGDDPEVSTHQIHYLPPYSPFSIKSGIVFPYGRIRLLEKEQQTKAN